MDFLERLNRRFGGAYERIIGGASGSDGELRPKDILRRILIAMEDGRREGLDGQVYVPNDYALHIAVNGDEERQYLLTFLDAAELGAAVRRTMDQHGYRTKGGLRFAIEESAAPDTLNESHERVRIVCRFDPSIPQEAKAGAAAVAAPKKAPAEAAVAPVAPPRYSPQVIAPDDDHELGTIPAFAGGVPLATLLVRGADGQTRDAVPLTARGLAIGRGKQSGNDVVLADGMVSKRHARFVYENGVFAVEDENSTNGTFLNGAQMAPGARRSVTYGDEVRVGETLLVLQPVQSNNGAAAQAAAAKVTGGYRLVAGDGEMFRLASDMTLGRALTCDLHILGSGVSDRHARLRVSPSGDALTLEDLDSQTGTFVNGERVPPRYAITIYDGDQIALGDVLLRVERTRG